VVEQLEELVAVWATVPERTSKMRAKAQGATSSDLTASDALLESS
jgi:hypothetical protein